MEEWAVLLSILLLEDFMLIKTLHEYADDVGQVSNFHEKKISRKPINPQKLIALEKKVPYNKESFRFYIQRVRTPI